VIYCNLENALTELRVTHSLPVYGTFMEGEDIYKENLSSKGVIVMGNEGNGISPKIEKVVSKKIHIPTFANNRTAVESLNVAMATAIVCSEFRRRV
jgi:TrmH family RNA methyltransferase